MFDVFHEKLSTIPLSPEAPEPSYGVPSIPNQIGFFDSQPSMNLTGAQLPLSFLKACMLIA